LPKCELCKEDHGRRKKRLVNRSIKMLCWDCWWQLENGNLVDTTLELAKYRKYYFDAEKKINELKKTRQWEIINQPKRYPYSNPWSAIPPIHVLKNAVKALDDQEKYKGFPEVLGDYYGIETPPYSFDASKVPEGAIACYYPTTNIVYTKEKTIDKRVAFHEMYHALERHGIIPMNSDSEKNAEFYAYACLARLEGKI